MIDRGRNRAMRVDFLDTGQETPCMRSSRPSKQRNVMNYIKRMLTINSRVQEDKRRRMQTVRSAQEATLEY